MKLLETRVSQKRHILITGVSGLLGGNLADAFRKNDRVVGLYHAHPVDVPGVHCYPTDILKPEMLSLRIQTDRPDVVIHCTSLTDVDACEENPESAKDLNVVGTRNVMNAAEKVGAKLIYISTDSVYDGVDGCHIENDATPAPLNVYGQTKLEGEVEALRAKGALVLRTNIFGWNITPKNSIGEWVLQNLQEDKPIHGFADAVFSTIYTYELARVIDLAIQENLSGVFNCCAHDACSKFEFAKKIADRFGFDAGLITAESIDDSDLKAKRGKKLDMDATRLESALGYQLPTVDQSIDRFYRDYHCGIPHRLKTWGHQISQSKPFIQYGKQWINREDIEAVEHVMQSNRLTQGPKVNEFESAVAAYCGAQHAVAVNSGTSALHIACLAADLKPGEEIITSPITFVASGNCALYCGGRPKFCDIDAGTGNMSPEKLEQQISSNTRIVIPVHFAGQSCPMDRIQQIVRNAERRYGRKIFIIEDASHALGSLYKGMPVGACKYADMTVTSFHPVKHITTGEGGMVLCNDVALKRKLTRLRSHGIHNNPQELIQKDQAFDEAQGVMNPWYYEQVDLGYNYRITDIQCALGLSQIGRLDEFRERRRNIVNRYSAAFSGLPAVTLMREIEESVSNFHLYVLRLAFSDIGLTRREMMESLLAENIQTQVHYIPVHTQPYYQQHLGCRWGDFPIAEAYYEQCLSIPLYPAMSKDESNRVIAAITGIVRRQM